jgi:hypothetical protein
MIKANVSEIEKIIKEMQPNTQNTPGYNEAAARLVQVGVKDKLAARADANPFKPRGKLLS